MTRTRAALADAVRPFGPDGKLLAVHLPPLWALADALGIPDTAERRVTPEGIAFLHEMEGYRGTTYRDPGPTGLPITGGFGTTRDENGKPFARAGIVRDRAYWETLFARDLEIFEIHVRSQAPETTSSQFDALVSFAYNVGGANLQGSTLLRKHNAGDYRGAAAEFARWNRAGGKVLPGLTRRRAREAAIYAKGSYK